MTNDTLKRKQNVYKTWYHNTKIKSLRDYSNEHSWQWKIIDEVLYPNSNSKYQNKTKAATKLSETTAKDENEFYTNHEDKTTLLLKEGKKWSNKRKTKKKIDRNQLME